MRPIDADALDVEQINAYYAGSCRTEDVQEWLDDQPTLDVEPVRHGRWGISEIVGYDGIHTVYAVPCSVCGEFTQEYLKPYCPNCGAKMDGGEADD